MKTARKIFLFIIISLLFGEIENQMVAQPELVQPMVHFQPVVQPVVQPEVQPMVQSMVQPMGQPVVQPVVQPMVQPYPYLVAIPSYGQVNNYRYGIIRYFIKIILVFITYH